MELDFSLIQDLAIGGVALVPIIIGLVSLLKRFGWLGADDQYAPYAAGALSVAAYGAVEALRLYPQFLAYAVPVTTAVFIFLVVSGVYQLAKTNSKSAKAKSK